MAFRCKHGQLEPGRRKAAKGLDTKPQRRETRCFNHRQNRCLGEGPGGLEPEDDNTSVFSLDPQGVILPEAETTRQRTDGDLGSEHQTHLTTHPVGILMFKCEIQKTRSLEWEKQTGSYKHTGRAHHSERLKAGVTRNTQSESQQRLRRSKRQETQRDDQERIGCIKTSLKLEERVFKTGLRLK